MKRGTRAPRALCASCAVERALRGDGTVWHHRLRDGSTLWARRCPGALKPPAPPQPVIEREVKP